ncbi:MAG: D-alanyl-D-alanine carboxypeptidase [Clostridia bacterium]|nr:D-alanyl-D-alanine carboxypeptidase [Clostridia bacterium]
MRSHFLKRIGCIIFAFAIFFTPVYASTSDALETVGGLSAQSHCLLDADTGTVLSSSNADQALPMASTTKIMTCILALEVASPAAEVLIPQEAVGVEGSSVYLSKGEKLTLEELLYALMLESANDAAVAIAIFIDGSEEAFADRMNEKAREIGMNSTNFRNPHGLPCEGHFSTARDMCRLMAYSMENEVFSAITSTKTKSISAPDGKTRFLSNHNRLLRSLETCIGGKTGYTKTAGRCLVTAAEEKGKTLVCATLGDPNDWKDHTALFEYGFSLYEEKCLAEIGALSMEIPVVGGEMKNIRCVNADSFSLPLLANEMPKVYWELPQFVYAPIESGDILGEAVFTLNGEEVGRVSVIAEDNLKKEYIEPGFFEKIWNNIKMWWQTLWNK